MFGKAFRKPSLSKSIALHALILGLAFLFVWKEKPLPLPSEKLDVQVVTNVPGLKEKGIKSASKAARPHSAKPTLDLRPDFMKNGALLSKAISSNEVSSGESTAIGDREEMLNAPLHVLKAFDHLAFQIYQDLEYPQLFVENNIEGNASLDLHFDSEGRIDEIHSIFSGNHHAVRGLFVQAARKGIQEWYRSDAYRLHKDQFKNQYFHASLEITTVFHDYSEVTKSGAASYQIIKRKFKNPCASPLGVDLKCLALKASGAVENAINHKSRIMLQLLEDKLDHYDDLGLSGINDLIRKNT